MRKIFFIPFLFLGLAAVSQINQQYLGTTDNTIKVRNDLVVDSALIFPADTLKSAPVGSGAIKNGVFYVKGSKWIRASDTSASTALRILYHPANLTKQIGQSAVFSIVFSGGKAPFRYQWQKNGTNRTADTLQSLTISSTALSDTGNYRVRITDSTGTIIFSNYANLSVISASSGGGGGGSITFAVDTSQTRGATHVVIFGNSLSYGTGGTATVEYPGGLPYGEYLRNLSGYDVKVFGYPGASSTTIKNNFIAYVTADPSRLNYSYIFEMGTNNSGSPTTVKADIDTVVARLTAVGNTHYLVVGIPGQSASSYWVGTGNYTSNTALNSDLSTKFGVRFVNIKAALNAYPASGATSQDTVDHNHGIPLLRYMAPSDETHFNDAGNVVWANTLNSKMYLMKPTTDEKAVGTGSLVEIFKNAPPVTTSKIATARAAIGFPALRFGMYSDAGGYNSLTSLDVNGNTIFWNSRADAGKEGGIVIRNHYNDFGGFAAMAITGTNKTYWGGGGNGIVIYNHAWKIDIGAPTEFLTTIYAKSLPNGTGTIDSALWPNPTTGLFEKRKIAGSGGGSGTVTTFSAGDLSPLFTTTETNPTTTPALSFSLSNASGFTVFGRGSGIGAPSYITLDTTFISAFAAKVRSLLSAGSGITYNPSTGVISNSGGGGGGGATTISADSIIESSNNKVFTSTERTKLSGIATGATANQTDAYLLSRTNHTGTQAISTVTSLQSTLDAKFDSAVAKIRIAQMIKDSLDANAKSLANGTKPGYERAFKFSGNKITGIDKTITAANSSIVVEKNLTDSSSEYLLSVGPVPSLGPKFRIVTTTTATINGIDGFIQVVKLSPTGNCTINLPTSSDAGRLHIEFDNTTSFTIAFNVPIYETGTPISAGATVIGASGAVDITRDEITGNYYMRTVR